jgi:outer membrane protein TolC
MVLAMNQTVSVTNTTTQNIFNKNVFTGLQAAKSVRQAAQLSEVQIREQVVYNVTSTYYSIQVLYDNLGRLNENIKSLEETVRINGVLKENELLPQNVYNRLLINLENLRNQYENQKLVYDKNVNALKYLMNLPQDETLAVTPFDYTEMIEMPQVGSIMQRPDIRLQQAQIRLSEYDKKSVAAGYFPVLVGGMTTGFTSYYDEFAPGKQINNDWIKSNYAFLTLKMNMFDGFKKKYQIKQKEVAIQKNINTLDMMKSNADKEVRDAVTNYETNVRLFQSSKTSLELADQLFTSAQSEYSNGLTSVSDLLNAQTDLTNARSNYSNALLNMKLAQLSLKKADGSLVNTFE